jgi:hypothetical protein
MGLGYPHEFEYQPFISSLMYRLRDFPSGGDLCVGRIYGIFDHGWEFQLDGGGHVVGYLQHRCS